MTTHAALLSGFSFTALVRGQFSDDVPMGFQGTYTVIVVVAIVMLLHCVFMATLCNTMGPNLAMRGDNPERAVDQAVQGMTAASYHVYGAFVGGVIIFQIAIVMWCCAKLQFEHESRGWAVIVGIAIASSLTFTISTSARLYNTFFRLNMYSVDSEWMAFRNRKKGVSKAARGADNAGEGSHESASLLGAAGGGAGGGGRAGGPGFTCQRCRHPVGPQDRYCSKCNHSLLGL